LECHSTGASIKDNYRTLVGFEGVNVVETYANFDEEEDDEKTFILSSKLLKL
jgi:hypothetical protein